MSALFFTCSIGPSAAQAGSSAAHVQTPSACSTYGGWIDVKSGQPIDRAALYRDLTAKNGVVLLGEFHTNADHHRLQLQALAALHGLGRNLVIGFEAFPRRLQSVLDDWIAGKLSEEEFLKASQWRQVWGYDSGLYMPLFEFARLNRIPMVALNVERSLVARVGREGWEAVPLAEREGLSDPVPASEGYRRELARVYAVKKTLGPEGLDRASTSHEPPPAEPDEAAIAEAMKQPEFKRFVEAQLTWDRAMAQALAAAKQKFADATVVGILGAGHVEDGYGVPHQLEALGVAGTSSLIPTSVDEACKIIGTAYADAVFTLPQQEEAAPPERPRLGVLLAQGDRSPRIDRVVGDSVAEAAGLKAGDDVLRAAGLEMRNPDDLVEVVGRQAPGTWLPLSIRRDGQEIDIVAKFPPRAKQER
ncbi:MAG TPA: ChaN family lipoprotein [Xanthobacteraceae bacterium]